MAEFNAERYEQFLSEEMKEERTAPAKGVEDVRGRTFDAFAAGMVDVATLGLLDEIRAGVRTMPGENYKERYLEQLEIESARGDALAQQNFGVGMLGSIVGGLTGGTTMNLGIRALLKLSKSGTKFLTKTNQNMFRRLSGSTAIGIAEGGTYAFNENLSVPIGMTMGFVFGATGQAVLGELFPGMWRAIKGNPTKWDNHAAKEEVVRLLMEKHPDLAEESAEAVYNVFRKTMKKLGPKATLSDVSEEIRATNLGMIADPARVRSGVPFMKVMSARMRDAKLNDRMQIALGRILGGGEALTPTQVKAQAAQDFKTYSPTFEKILRETNASFPAGPVAKVIEDGFASGGITTNEATSAFQAMMKFLKNNGAKFDKDGVVTGSLNAVQMDGVVKQLDALYNSQTDPFSPATDKILRKQIASLRKSIKRQLNRIPGYRAINEDYMSTTSAVNAYDVGVKLVTKDIQDWSALESIMEEVSTTDMFALMDGVKWSLVNILKEAGDDPSTAVRLFNNENLREKLFAAFGGATTNRLFDSARSAAKFAETENFMDIARLRGLTGASKSDVKRAADVAMAVGGIGTDYLSSAIGWGSFRKSLDDIHGARARKDQAFSNLTSRSGPEADALLNQALPQTQAGRPLDPTDLLSSGLGAFGAKALPGERRGTQR